MILTKPETQVYSNIKTITSGAINVNRGGSDFSLALMPLNLSSMAVVDGHFVQSMVAITISGILISSRFFCGVRSISQNVIASKTGIISIIFIAVRGCIPANVVKAAYDIEPSTPAAPVPDDQAGITRLSETISSN